MFDLQRQLEREVMVHGGNKYVVGIDVGTTTARSLVYDVKGEVVGESHAALEPLMPRPGWYELDPDKLWVTVCQVIREAISSAGLEAGDISGLGISCQRATFTCWSAVTGKHFHNLITWKDIRADSYVRQWNARFGPGTSHCSAGWKYFISASL